MEVCGHDANDLTTHAFKFDRASDDCGIASETLFPKSVAQDNIVVSASGVFTRTKRTSEFWPGSQDRQQFSGNFGSRQPDRLSKAGEIEFVALGIGGDVHRMDLLTHGNERTLRIGSGHADQFLRFWVRQGDEQDAIDQAEDGSVGTDAERQCNHRNRGETRALAQLAHRVPHILYQAVHRFPLQRPVEPRTGIQRNHSATFHMMLSL